MNFRKSQDDSEGAFQIAPMIDVVFIMLVFFTYISVRMHNEREVDIRPPVAGISNRMERKPEDILINVSADGRIVVNRMEWDLPTLRERLKHISALSGGTASVKIRADGRTYHQNIVSVIDACVDANIQQFSFLTVEGHAEDAPRR